MVERKDYLFETFRKGSRMAGNGQKKEQQKRDRIVPGVQSGKSSRVSKAAGGIGSGSMRNEQRSSSSSSPPRSRAGARIQGQRSSRKGPATSVGSKRGAPFRPPMVPADSRLISQVRQRWSRLQPHEQQRIFSVVLLLLACFLTCGLTVWRTLPLFRPLADFFFGLFTWAAIPLSLGLVAFAIAHLVEGMRNIRVIRWSLVLGLLALVVLLLAESQLLLGGLAGGAVGGLLATAIQSWGFGAHVLVLGLLVVTVLLTFRITVSQVLVAGSLVRRIFLDPRDSSGQATSRPVSPYLGERPRLSRYGSPAQENPARRPGQRQRPAVLDEPDDEDEDEDEELEEPADHTNDINQHIDQVGRVPKGPRPAQKLDRAEPRAAVRGASQQPLPFGEKASELDEMEPLAPNPLHTRRPQVLRRAAALVGVSPWKPPEGTLFNNPQDLKQQLLGEDVSGLAKTIQDTLRSFRVDAEVRPEDISIGPTVIRFGIRPTGKPLMKEDERGRLAPVKDAAGNVVYEVRTRVSRIMALQNDLALVLESKTIRMEAPVPGRPYIGVEIPNKQSRLVTLREVLESKEYQAARARSKLTVALGRDVGGAVRVGDLGKMPHLLIAGATGAGKCLAYDEPVFLADGRVVRVQTLIGESVEVIGLRDLSTMHQMPVPAIFADNGMQEVFEITLAHGLTLRRTGEHPLWAALPGAARGSGAAEAGWVKSSELRAGPGGHVVLCPLVLAALRESGELVGVGQVAGGVRRAQVPAPGPAGGLPICPPGYQWREVRSIDRRTAATVSIAVQSANHAFVGDAVEHNSVMINTIISSIISQSTPDDVRLLMIDPKMVELTMYNGIPHLLSPVVTEVDRVVGLLKIAITEMEKRYRLFSQLGVRNLDGYRKLRVERGARAEESLKNLPAIVIIIDELADLMMAAPEEVEGLICRLAQLARATGIHLVVATQRPSVDVITGLIKANIPTRISFMVSSAVDSRTIIDMGGAERLLGRGDMLYLPADAGKPERIQGAFVADEEAERLVQYWHQQVAQQRAGSEQAESSTPGVEPGWEVSERSSSEFELEDDLLEQAEQVVQEHERASISLLQRRLKIGYARAARLIDLLEAHGVISRAEPGGRAREILEPRGQARSGEQGRTLADEAAEIMEEERQRQEAVRRQAGRERAKQGGSQSSET